MHHPTPSNSNRDRTAIFRNPWACLAALGIGLLVGWFLRGLAEESASPQASSGGRISVVRPVPVTSLPPDQGTRNAAPQTKQATPSARHENPAGTPIVSQLDREQEILKDLHSSELKRRSTFTYPPVFGESPVKIILERASAEEIDAVLAETEARMEMSKGRADIAWRARIRALVLEHLAYPKAKRVLNISFPRSSSQATYGMMDLDSVNIDPKTGVEQITTLYSAARLTEAEAVKRFGHLFQIKQE